MSGIDYGSRRIGLAIAEADGRFAAPAGVLAATGRPGDDAVAVVQWAAGQEVTDFVVGLPLNMDGSEGPQAHICRRFADELRARIGGQGRVELWDERLSSFQADEYLDERGLKGSRRKQRRDALAALVILQSYFRAKGTP